MSESRVKQSAKNMMSGFLYQLVSLVLSFISRSIFIRTLGTEYLGLNSIFSDVLMLLSMADLGFGTAMAYSFYKPLAENNHKMIAALIGFYKKVYNVIAAIVLVLGIACIPFLKFIINTEQEIPHLEIYYLFSLANVVISYLYIYKTTLLTADQKNYMVVQVSIWTNVAKTVLQIGVLFFFQNYILYLAIGSVIQFVNNAIASRKAEQEYPYIKKLSNENRIDGEEQKKIFANMKSVFIYKISTTMFTATDNIIISMIVGTAIVGLYSNYLLISGRLLLLEQIVFSALTASIGNVIVKENEKKRLQVFQAMQSASFIFCGIICSAFCLLANDLITVWLGPEYMLSYITLVAITLNTYLACVLQPLWIYRDATGLYQKTKYVMLIAAVVNVGLSIVLGHVMGIAGVIFASAIARLSTYFWYEPKLLFRDYFNTGPAKYYISIVKNILLVATTVGVIQYLSKGFIVSSWGMIFAKGIIIGGGCCMIFIVAYARSEGFQIIMEKVKMIVGKLRKIK